MALKKLVIVESPSKAKTIEKFLGSQYKVIASVGHLRDLPKSKIGVDLENNFEPHYINVRGKGDTINEIRSAAKNADKIYLATDPDREGEAISWHLCYILGIDPSKANRITFQEITKNAVTQAIKAPRALDMELINAQQGRRILDRIVGYKISPLLWAKAGKGLSAGRVQSAALKTICDREKEIENFNPKEYWTINSCFTKQGLSAAKEKKESFLAFLEQYKGEKIAIENKEMCDKICKDLDAGKYIVKKIEEKQTSRKPYAPYTTSVMQQDASSKLNFQPKKTMMIAQQLYEGVLVEGKGHIGLVSYIRTDSVRISEQADAAAKDYVKQQYGDNYVGNNVFSNKKKGAQDAHEAIRPSYIDLTPDALKNSLSSDQYKLYKLIWTRFIASRMKPANYDAVALDVANGDYTFHATGRKLTFDGFLKLYEDGKEKDETLPLLEEGQELKLLNRNCEQKFTEAPPRFTEASLIKYMEEKGIGRPSTYAPIVSHLVDKCYLYRDKKTLYPTELGMRISKEIMEVYFKDLVNADFTAAMEEQLDLVEEGKQKWQDVVSNYYHKYLEKQLKNAEEHLEKFDNKPQYTGNLCPLCQKPLVIRKSRFGEFIGCSDFPNCHYTENIVIGIGVSCPACGKDIVKRQNKKGKVFYSCSGYPDCKMAYWGMPVNKKCPKCSSLLIIKGKKLVCSGEKCAYSEERKDEEE